MPTKRQSASSSRAFSVRTERAGRSRVAAFARGEIALPVRMVNTPEPVNVRALRRKMGLSQSQFAAQYGIALRTLQEWEQGRTVPDGAVRAYLTVIERNPRAVSEALAGR